MSIFAKKKHVAHTLLLLAGSIPGEALKS